MVHTASASGPSSASASPAIVSDSPSPTTVPSSPSCRSRSIQNASAGSSRSARICHERTCRAAHAASVAVHTAWASSRTAATSSPPPRLASGASTTSSPS